MNDSTQKRLSATIKRLSVALAAALCLVAPRAEAYVRARTCSPEGSVDTKRCRPDQQPFAVYWAQPCVTYYVNRQGSEDLGGLPDRLLEAIEASFQTWQRVDCGAVSFAFGGLTCNEHIGLEDQDITGGNQNLILWRDRGWEDATDAIAVTVLSPSPEDGRILDADIMMNGEHFDFALLDDADDTVADVQNTLTHEIGHMIGFAHETSIFEATMFPDATPGELSKRDLHPDDVRGLCEVYPASGAEKLCSPDYVEDLTCTLEYGGELRCEAAPPGAASHLSSPPRALFFIAALLGFLFACMRLGGRRARFSAELRAR